MSAADTIPAAVTEGVAELIRGGLVSLPHLDKAQLDAVLNFALAVGDRELSAAVYPEVVIRSLLCGWCASLLLRSPAARERWIVVHEAGCLIWQRYTRREGGYTAKPSGVLWRGDQPWPPGAAVVISNTPGAPCGAVVTWRGPYTSGKRQQAAERTAVRRGTKAGDLPR